MGDRVYELHAAVLDFYSRTCCKTLSLKPLSRHYHSSHGLTNRNRHVLVFIYIMAHSSFRRLFSTYGLPPPPYHDWIRFEDFDILYFPPKLGKVPSDAAACFYYWQPPKGATWGLFSRDFRCSQNRLHWYDYSPSTSKFAIDGVFCGLDFVVVQSADPGWRRWMVVWIHHEMLIRCSRYGRLMRRRKGAAAMAACRGTCKQANLCRAESKQEQNVELFGFITQVLMARRRTV